MRTFCLVCLIVFSVLSFSIGSDMELEGSNTITKLFGGFLMLLAITAWLTTIAITQNVIHID